MFFICEQYSHNHPKYFIYFIHWCELPAYHTCIIQELRESRQAESVRMKPGTHASAVSETLFFKHPHWRKSPPPLHVAIDGIHTEEAWGEDILIVPI